MLNKFVCTVGGCFLSVVITAVYVPMYLDRCSAKMVILTFGPFLIKTMFNGNTS